MNITTEEVDNAFAQNVLNMTLEDLQELIPKEAVHAMCQSEKLQEYSRSSLSFLAAAAELGVDTDKLIPRLMEAITCASIVIGYKMAQAQHEIERLNAMSELDTPISLKGLGIPNKNKKPWWKLW